MSRARAFVAATLCAALAGIVAAAAEATPEPSRLALARVTGTGTPELIAQRVIEREWGPSEDSVYKAIDLREWKSEGFALGASAALPGVGELYTGEKSGFLFAIAEVAGWTANLLYRHDARHLRDEAAAVAGAPGDTASGWSAARWSAATGSDPAALERLYAADHEAYWNLIASDPAYASGWRSGGVSGEFQHLRGNSDDQFGRARMAGVALFLNHVLSAADALKAARLHNLPLQKNLELQLRGSIGSHGGVMAALERRF
jgi:hypothetical protein